MLDIPEEVKALFRRDSIKKNFRIHFPNGEREDITNENILSESVQFTESLCSQENLKFGLCEASVLEFETIDIGNIKGCEIEAGIEADIPREIKLNRSFEDETYTYEFLIPYSGRIMIYTPIEGENYGDLIMEWYKITWENSAGEIIKEMWASQGTSRTFRVTDAIKIEIYFRYNVTMSMMQFPDIDTYNIPYGRFTVDSCRIQGYGTSRRKVIAYGGLTSLQQSPFQEILQKNRLLEDTTYTIDVDRYVYSNVKNPNIKFAMSEEFVNVRDNDGIVFCERATGRHMAPNIFPSKTMHGEWYIYTDDLAIRLDEVGAATCFYKINYIKCNNYQKQMEVVSKIYADSGYQYTGNPMSIYYPMLQLWLGNEMSFVDYACDFDTRYLLSLASVNNLSKSIMVDINLPYAVHYKFVPSGENEEDIDYETITLADKASLTRLSKPEVSFFSYVMEEAGSLALQFEREKKEEGHYQLKEENILSKILEGYAELNASFGCMDRNGEFGFRTIQNNFGLYPSEDVFPESFLYPQGANATLTACMYKTLMCEEIPVREIKSVKVSNWLNGGEHSEVFGDDTGRTYDMTNNYILRQLKPSYGIAAVFAGIFLENVKNISYVPAELEMKGLPYIEVGDVLNILTMTGGIETCVLRRTMSGIQSLEDSIETVGKE